MNFHSKFIGLRSSKISFSLQPVKLMNKIKDTQQTLNEHSINEMIWNAMKRSQVKSSKEKEWQWALFIE